MELLQGTRTFLSSLITCLILGASLLLSSNVFGQVPVKEELLETVNFLYPYSIENGQFSVGAGTGFALRQEETGQFFLITAKHVLTQKSGSYFPNLCIRQGTKDGSDFIPVKLSGKGASRVFTHATEPDVDIAVIPGIDIPLPRGLPADRLIGTHLGTSLFATKEHFSKGTVQLGDEVFFMGWFQPFFGQTRNYPIVRFGRLSFRTDEQIPWQEQARTSLLDLYLIEAWPTRGNSGGPVFFHPNLQREPGTFNIGGPTILLAGVLKGFFGVPLQAHAGIGAVVPAFKLSEILSHESIRHLERLPELAIAKDEDVQLCRKAESAFRVRQQTQLDGQKDQ
jgi:hypothetical protein